MNELQARSETVIDAQAGSIWAVITDISQIHKINRGVIKATGSMNTLNCTRTSELDNRGKTGTMTERLIELEPGKRTIWTIESDNMGMGKMLKDTWFCFPLEQVTYGKTKVVSETWYRPANVVARVMNALMMKKLISGAQEKILYNLKRLTENK